MLQCESRHGSRGAGSRESVRAEAAVTDLSPVCNMGITESREQSTPARPLRNPHLSHLTDPRSPTAGIMRTPIEVGSSSRQTPLAAPEAAVTEPPGMSDPRSPSLGIVRTPLRQSIHESLNHLAKQLSEVFVAEDSGIEGSPEAEVQPPADVFGDQAAGDELPLPAPDVKEEEAAEEPASLPTGRPEAPAEQTPPALHKPNLKGKSPRAAGAKKVRQRTRKSLINATPGRSPLKILQEDNSPSTTVHNRQVKLSFQSEQPSSLKILHSSWEMSHNKENALYTHSET